MQFIDESKHIRNMLDHVTTNDLFEFVINEWVWKRSEVMNDISMTQAIRIDADRSRKLILTTTDIKNFLLR